MSTFSMRVLGRFRLREVLNLLNMPELEISKDVLTSFAGTLLALLSAGLVWFLKSAYEKHRAEKLALAKFERIFANNLTILRDSFDYLDKWVAALQKGRPYSFHFEKYFIDEDETFRLSNLELINSILSINSKLRRTSLDLENVYKNYWEIIFKIDSIQDQMRKEADLLQYHKTVIDTLQEIKLNYEPLKNDLINSVALVRAVNKVKFHSLFGYLSLFFVDVFPRITKKSVKREIDKLNKNIQEKSEMKPFQGTLK